MDGANAGNCLQQFRPRQRRCSSVGRNCCRQLCDTPAVHGGRIQQSILCPRTLLARRFGTLVVGHFILTRALIARGTARCAVQILRARCPGHLRGRPSLEAQVSTGFTGAQCQAFRNDHFTALGIMSQPYRVVYGIADDRIAHVSCRTDVADHHLTVIDADTQTRLNSETLWPMCALLAKFLLHRCGAKQRAVVLC
jgi:hypothetical protein